MDFLPSDPAILVSSINMLLRDEEFDSLEQICYAYNREPEDLKRELQQNGYVYSEEQRQVRPIGFDAPSIPHHAIETAYAFFHQKLRIYTYSTLDWQRDDIEYAITDYVSQMNSALYNLISNSNNKFLLEHTTFQAELTSAVDKLESML